MTQTDEGYFSIAARSGISTAARSDISQTARSSGENIEEEEDSATVYSDFSDMSESRVDNCVSELAADLLSKLPPDSATRNKVASILADRLRGFALRVGYQGRTQMHLDVMVFIHKYRR